MRTEIAEGFSPLSLVAVRTLHLVAHQCFGADLRVLDQRSDRSMTGSPHEHRRPGSGLGVVRQRGVLRTFSCLPVRSTAFRHS